MNAPLIIRDRVISTGIVQGGMGAGFSLELLAGRVSQQGGLGVVSSVGLDRIVSKRVNKKLDTAEATALEISLAKSRGGIAGINIMKALVRDFTMSIQGALEANVDVIFSGAGLPLDLPKHVGKRDVGLVPIVSSKRSLEAICRWWERHHKRRPDAVVLEGPLAGGHLGFGYREIFNDAFSLESIFPEVKEYAMNHGDFPVIVAGGIDTPEKVNWWRKQGADGTQHGTLFLATEESGASDNFKSALIAASKEDIIVVDGDVNPLGSPCLMTFRILRTSPMFREPNQGRRTCEKGYVLQMDKDGRPLPCMAIRHPDKYFCICNGLFAACAYEDGPEIWTVGAHAWRIKQISTVYEVMNLLTGSA